jgi:transcription-repair coupling factor (superfamily II helicase)
VYTSLMMPSTSIGHTPLTTTHWLRHALAQSPWLANLSQRLRLSNANIVLPHPPNPSVLALVLDALLAQTGQSVVWVAHDTQTLLAVQAALEKLWHDTPKRLAQQWVRYPTEVFSPYDLAVVPAPVLQGHYAFLEALHERPQPRHAIYALCARNLATCYPSWHDRQRHALTLHVGQHDADPDDVLRQAQAMGYHSVGLVLEPGDLSRRGDIMDVYPLNGPPVRVSFFGDTVESIRLLDVDNQRSIEVVNGVTLLPRSQLVLTPERREALPALLTEALQAQAAAHQGSDLEGLAATIASQLAALNDPTFWPDGLDYYAALAGHSLSHLAADLPAQALLVLDDWNQLLSQWEGLTQRLEAQRLEGAAKGRLLALPIPYHVSLNTLVGSLCHTTLRPTLLLQPQGVPLNPVPFGEASGEGKNKATNKLGNPWLQPGDTPLPSPAATAAASPDGRGYDAPLVNDRVTHGTATLPMAEVPRFQADIPKAIEAMQAWRKQGLQVLVTTDYPQRLLDLCKEADLPADYWPDSGATLDPDRLEHLMAHPDAGLLGLPVIISKTGLTDGFQLIEARLLHLTDAELFGRLRARRLAATDPKTRKRRDDADVIQSLAELRPGDYVVHIKHGIGQFVELQTITLDKQKREYLTIQYRGNDKLFVPVDQVNLLTRYRGAGDTKPQLSKMGGTDWSRVKKKVTQSIAQVAGELVQLARQQVKGFCFEPDSPWQVEMEEAFPYEETPDQFKAIVETKADMESDKPMDRLICGDVGFGKTEVALRALFKCVLSGKQGAVLVPTTILAQQHFNTVVERFQPYGVKVGLLSRFRSAKEQAELAQRLREGQLDVVVATHRLLQKDVVFKDLGLLVIDEEHRFGVTHKEKIKQLRTHVDVLTMSATPIPRTLYMSLSGVREMTLISTPPTNRLPVQTLVGPYNTAQVRMAIRQELDRDGQVYYLHNRVQSIYDVGAELEALVPEARVAVAHGQLAPHELEQTMLAFANHEFDVLVCTTIVESGVDIPNANTLIMDDANRYGLAQLYQLRGRVGRSDHQAYAYLYYPPDTQLTDDAKNRLRAIRELTALGSGYHIAMRDMEIRGVGNILGAEQHGHMIQVGFDLYCDMLNQAVEAVQAGKSPLLDDAKEPSVIDLNVTALIPEAWVGDRDVKLSEYKRLANITTLKGLELILAEWRDRFGPVPDQAQQLVRLAQLRVLATLLGIPLVRNDDTSLRISLPYNLQTWMQLQAKLTDVPHADKLRWMAAVRSSAGEGSGCPTLVLRHTVLGKGGQVAFLLSLFEALRKLQEVGA